MIYICEHFLQCNSPSSCNFAHCDILPLVLICAMTYPLICVMTSDASPTWITVKFTATFTAHQHWTLTFVLFYSDSCADLLWQFLCDEITLQRYSCIICEFFLNFATDNFMVHLLVWALVVSKVTCTVKIYSANLQWTFYKLLCQKWSCAVNFLFECTLLLKHTNITYNWIFSWTGALLVTLNWHWKFFANAQNYAKFRTDNHWNVLQVLWYSPGNSQWLSRR